jgi:hypothetical protein
MSGPGRWPELTRGSEPADAGAAVTATAPATATSSSALLNRFGIDTLLRLSRQP